VELEVDLRGAEAQARLLEPDDFGSFRVVLVEDGKPLNETLSAVGIARLDEHAWVRLETLRELAGAAVTPEWEASLAGMLDFARQRDWVDDELGAVRGHVIRRRAE
jgi:hypothetical protein